MFGIGVQEFAIILIVLLLLLGAPAVFGFWLGYQAGKSKGADDRDAGGKVEQSGEQDGEDTSA